MKKRIVSLFMVAALAATMFAGCGKKETSSEASASDGKVLNIQCWNDEFRRFFTAHYDGYEKIDDATGKIGDVTVRWTETANKDNAYQENLDRVLQNQESAEADDKVDLFLVEADYALKYVDTDYVLPIKDLGITDEDTKDMYQYTKDIVTDSNGNLKGVSWQACPGIMFYNRDIAKDVLGTDDPEKVQEYVKDWDTFNETADLMLEKGYKMTSSVTDTYRTYSNNVSGKWVEDGKLSIDDNIMNWVDDSMKMVEKGETAGTAEILSDDWGKCMYEDQAVFCTFGPAWMINFSMHADEEGSVANAGKWAGCVGPQSFYWGGTWLCAANGTDNADLVKDIMYKFSCDEAVLKELVVDEDQFANNKNVMNEMAKSDYTSEIMGGQNPLPMYCAGAEKIDLSNLSAYDQGCNEEFQNAMKNYFDGNASKEDALKLFYKAISEKYPAVELPE